MMKKLTVIGAAILMTTACSTIPSPPCQQGVSCYSVSDKTFKAITLGNGSSGLSIEPYVIVEKSSKDDVPLIKHEIKHVIRQKEIGRFKWLWKYITDKEFRLNEEIIAYKVSIKEGMSINTAIDHLQNLYGFNVSKEELQRLLEEGSEQ